MPNPIQSRRLRARQAERNARSTPPNLRAMKAIINAIVNGWGKRQLLKFLAGFALVIGSNSEGAEATASFIAAAAAYGLEIACSRLAKKRLEKKAAAALAAERAAIPRAIPFD